MATRPIVRRPARSRRKAVAQRAFEQGPFAGADQPVVEHGGKQQQDESHHRRRHGPAVEQAAAEGPQQQPAIACLGRGEAGERTEHQREHLAVPQPGVAAECQHAGPGESRIGDRQPGDVHRRGGVGIDELGPGEGEQQQARRPGAEPLRIVHTPAKLAARAQSAVEPLCSVENGAPRIDEGPHVADEGRDVGKPHPPDDPHQGRRDVAVGVLVAEEPGKDGDDEQGQHGQPQRQGNRRMANDPSGRSVEEVELPARDWSRRVPHEQAEHDERQRHRRGGAEQIQRERKRQLVALAEAMGECRRLGARGDAGADRRPSRNAASVMIEKSATSREAGLLSGLLDLNHTRIIHLLVSFKSRNSFQARRTV